MKVPASVSVLALSVFILCNTAPAFGQFAGHRITAYGAPGDAFSSVSMDTRFVTPAVYADNYGGHASFLIGDQPLFEASCDVVGASAQKPTMSGNTGQCSWNVIGVLTQHFSTPTAAASFANSLNSVKEKDKASIVTMGTWSVVVYPDIVEACQ